jgi:deoxycytidine triphosphate deaminase
MIVGHDLLRLFLRLGFIYCDPPPVAITENSIQVTLGQWVAIEETAAPYIDLYIDDPAATFTIKSLEDTGMVISPGIRLIGHTHEFVGSKVAWLTPELRGRSTLACWGMELGHSALFGEPGFCSRWRVELFNSAGRPLLLKPGTEIGQVLFHLTAFGRTYRRPYNVPPEDWTPSRLLPKNLERPFMPKPA